jgi:hypothetical protein
MTFFRLTPRVVAVKEAHSNGMLFQEVIVLLSGPPVENEADQNGGIVHG